MKSSYDVVRKAWNALAEDYLSTLPSHSPSALAYALAVFHRNEEVLLGHHGWSKNEFQHESAYRSVHVFS
jgi:hypothetical protein